MTNVDQLVEIHPCRILFEEGSDETKTHAMSGCFVSDRCSLSDLFDERRVRVSPFGLNINFPAFHIHVRLEGGLTFPI
jgi:hypothetical protein